jgi:hypothetical protein
MRPLYYQIKLYFIFLDFPVFPKGNRQFFFQDMFVTCVGVLTATTYQTTRHLIPDDIFHNHFREKAESYICMTGLNPLRLEAGTAHFQVRNITSLNITLSHACADEELVTWERLREREIFIVV